MKKFHKIQMAVSVIPILSSFFVFIVTNIVLKKNRSDVLKWVYFGLIISISCTFVFFWNIIVMTGENPVLNLIASGAILAFANYLCVKLQIKSDEDKELDQQSVDKSKMIFKSVGFSALGVAVVFLMVLAIFVLIPSMDIEDMNGESTVLAVISDEEVLATHSRYGSTSSGERYDGSHTYVSHNYRDYDMDNYNFHCKNISGIKTLQMTQIEENTLTLNVDSAVASGNMEVFIIVDGLLYKKLEANQSHSVIIEDAAGKLVIVRMAAESAEMSISVSREY